LLKARHKTQSFNDVSRVNSYNHLSELILLAKQKPLPIGKPDRIVFQLCSRFNFDSKDHLTQRYHNKQKYLHAFHQADNNTEVEERKIKVNEKKSKILFEKI